MKSPRRPTEDLYILDEQIGFWLRVAMQRHRSIFWSKMPNDLTVLQFAALAKLLEVKTCSQNELGQLIYVDPATIKGVVDRLRKRGLLTIEIGNDRRRREVFLTEKGRQAAKQATKLATDVTAKTMVPLNKNQRRLILALLKQLVGVKNASGAVRAQDNGVTQMGISKKSDSFARSV